MTTPLPEGCTHCGLPRHGHYQRWTEGVGWHPYELPGPELVQARMRARFDAKETTA